MSAPCCPAGSVLRRGLFLLLIAVVVAIPILAIVHITMRNREDDAERTLELAAQQPAPPAPAATRPHADPAKQPGPRAEYGPDQVVQIVMDALQNNDDHDSGIVTTFNFASPDNKRLTGPVERFIPMVKNPAYRPMLNFRSAEYGELKLSAGNNLADQQITLLGANGEEAIYVFHLSKQPDGQFKGCWMTDGVARVQPKGPQA